MNKNPWQEFRDSGLLWWINMLLHTFGWAIVLQIENDGTISSAYPARVNFRGFDEKSNSEGYAKVAKYLKANINDIEKETNE